MGTNFYVHIPNVEVPIHIGKASAGWTFSFHGTEKIRSALHWRVVTAIQDAKILNEYGDELSYSEFWDIVQSKKTAPNNSSAKILADGRTCGHCNHTHYHPTKSTTCIEPCEHCGFNTLRSCYAHSPENHWLDEEGNSFYGGEFS